MSPRMRTFIVGGITAVLAVWSGHALATGHYFWPSLLLFCSVAAVLTWLFALPLDIISLGLVTFGYLVGNRGFAQLMPAPNIPLLPAEAALLLCGGWAFVASIKEHRVPWRLGLLDWCVLAWLVAGSIRFAFDFRNYGFTAARDFAMVYYAAFFFLAQRAAHQSPEARRYLIGAVVTGCALLPVFSLLYEVFPDFFIDNFRVYGVPILLYKGDLALMFTAVSAVVLFHWAKGRQRLWAWPYATGLFIMVMGRESRASILGCFVVLAVLIAARRWRFPSVQASAAIIALGLVAGFAALTGNNWAQARIDTVGAHLDSIVAPLHAGGGESDLAYKWDNNRFRLVWWRDVARNTWINSPVTGMGFGYDLASNFAQEYYPESTEEFTARSPHNVALTAFGRMGLVGLVIWLALVLAVVRSAWRSIRRDPDPTAWGLWSGLLIILVTAHLQVILEGPMGAVPFWVLLGIACVAEPSGNAEFATPSLHPAGESASA